MPPASGRVTFSSRAKWKSHGDCFGPRYFRLRRAIKNLKLIQTWGPWCEWMACAYSVGGGGGWSLPAGTGRGRKWPVAIDMYLYMQQRPFCYLLLSLFDPASLFQFWASFARFLLVQTRAAWFDGFLPLSCFHLLPQGFCLGCVDRREPKRVEIIFFKKKYVNKLMKWIRSGSWSQRQNWVNFSSWAALAGALVVIRPCLRRWSLFPFTRRPLLSPPPTTLKKIK